MMIKYASAFLSFLLILSGAGYGQVKSDPWLEKLLRKSDHPVLRQILNAPDTFKYQIIYTMIDRDKSNKPVLKNYCFNVDRNRYFYPASTVKLPVALLALEKLNEMNVPGLDKYTPMFTKSSRREQTPVLKDSTSANGLASVAHYVRKIFLVSDNDAYNRLYEFLGQQPMNEALWKKGFPDIRITHRFVKRSWEENKHTNAIFFVKGDRVIHEQPARYSNLKIDTTRSIQLGRRYINSEDKLVNQPMDFTLKNRFPLEDLQNILQSLLFPESVPESSRFNLTEDDRNHVLKSMSTFPYESIFPAYDTAEFFTSYTKFFFHRDGKRSVPPSIRIFNKAGWSYGCITDAAYIVDFEHNIEFMITATIYANRDETLNDDKYDYDEIAYPFFRAVGEAIYQYELNRKRKQVPDLSTFRFSYQQP